MLLFVASDVNIQKIEMRKYQLVLVLKSTLSDLERKKFLESLKTWFSTLKILKENEWGQKPLAYSIKKQVSGFYIELELEGEKIPSDLEKKLMTSDNILRHLLLRN